jgi:biotin carboxylase
VHGIVAPGTDWPVAVAARVAARLGLPHPLSPETAARAVSKLEQRACFAAAGVPQPRYALCRSAAEADSAWDALGPPAAAVVKPADRQGQAGIGVARTREEARAAVAAAVAASRGGVAVVEELVPGQEVTVNAFSVGGVFVPIAVTDRETDAERAFGVALAHVWPSRLPAAHIEAAARAAAAAAAALGVAEGPTYTQIVVDPGGRAHVVELAARLGGGHDAELCAAAVGVDLAALAVRAALGEAVDPQEARPAGAAPAGGAPGVGGTVTRFLVAERPGTLREVAGVAEAEALPGVRRIRVYRAAGAELGPLRRGNDRHGAVLAVGGSRAEALERAGRAAEAVRFLVSDGGADTA